MSKKIILIDPLGWVREFNTGLGYISATLKKAGHEVKVIDLNNNSKRIDERLLSAKNADIIGISIKSFTLKEINSKALLIAGDPHIKIDGINFMKNNDIFDIAVVGEGELIMVEIANGSDLSSINGIIYRKQIEGKIQLMINPGEGYVKNLDSLPFPDYTSFDSIDNLTSYPLITSRGCPYACNYCSVPFISGRKFRAREPSLVVEEIEYAINTYKVKNFDVMDDDFSVNIKRAKEILKEIIRKKLNINLSFGNGIRADRIDEELLFLMKEAGCQHIMFGVESGDEKVFNNINKGEKLETIINAIQMAKRIGIKSVGGFFIINLPGSTFESDLKSIALAKNLGLTIANFSIFVPYPGKKFWEILNNDKNIIFLRPWQEGFTYGKNICSVFETTNYREKDIIKMFYISNIRLYNYLAIIEGEKGTIKKGFKLVYIILKYDLKNFPKHINRLFFKLINLLERDLRRN
jgi:radical SAM superfamily enzyme YgiQ (UPF0313 family)